MQVAKSSVALFGLLLASQLFACDKDDPMPSLTSETGEGDGDGDPGDSSDSNPGDGDPGDGDGDPGDGDGDGTGDGDGDTGDGDGDGDACGVDPGWGTVAVGSPVKHVAARNHLGEEKNLCDWAGTPMIMDIAAVWCGPCNDASAYLAGVNPNDPFSGIGPDLRAMIDAGTIIWLTYLVEDANGADANVTHSVQWDMQYHHDNIPVLNELDTPMLPTYFQFGCWPTAWVIGPDMNFFGLDDCMTWNQLAAAVNEFGGG